MSSVRLSCPACDSVVRIPEATARAHPFVRCGKCQGLVNVVTARLPDTMSSSPALPRAVREDEPTRTGRKRPQPTSLNPRVLFAVAGGLILLALICFGGYLLFTSFGAETPFEKTARKTLDAVHRVAESIEAVQTPNDVAKVVETMQAFVGELKAIQAEHRDLKVSADEQKRVQEKYEPKFKEAERRLFAAMARLQTNPQLMMALAKEMHRFGPALMAIAAGMNPNGRPNLNLDPGMLAQNRPPANFNPPQDAPDANPPPAAPVNSADVDFELNTKTVLLKELVDRFKSITDSDSAETASLAIEGTLTALSAVEGKLRIAERQGKQATPAIVAQVSKEHFELLKDLEREITRVAGLPGVGRHLVRHDLKLRQLTLIPASVFKDDSRGEVTQRGGDTRNPFEEVAKGEEKNPFEAVKPGTSRNEADAGKPNPAVDAALEKVASTDGFKRHDGIRELLNTRSDEQHKTQVLDALLTVMEQADAHVMNDAFKAFRKWAATREDRERIGKVMETLLKDDFVRREVVRFVADHKIAAAAPELARLLKDNIYRLEAGRALIAIGPEAEKPILPLVTDLEPQVRRMAIEVLAQIGTKECIAELAKMQNDRFVGRAAREAIRLVQSRTKDK